MTKGDFIREIGKGLYAWSFVSAQDQRRDALAFLMAAMAREAGAGGSHWN